jgi:hypothetical protein
LWWEELIVLELFKVLLGSFLQLDFVQLVFSGLCLLPFSVLANDLDHVIPVRLFPLPLNQTQALLFLMIGLVAVTVLLELHDELEVLGRVFHLDLVAQEDHLVRVGLAVFGQEK